VYSLVEGSFASGRLKSRPNSSFHSQAVALGFSAAEAPWLQPKDTQWWVPSLRLDAEEYTRSLRMGKLSFPFMFGLCVISSSF
jgi:hypothetical protein